MTREEEYYRYCTQVQYDTYQHEGQPCIEDAIKWADTHPVNPWHKASEELPKDRVFLAHCIGMSRGFIDRILWNARNGGFDNLNDTFPSASIKESHFEDYYDYWMDIPEIPKEDKL